MNLGLYRPLGDRPQSMPSEGEEAACGTPRRSVRSLVKLLDEQTDVQHCPKFGHMRRQSQWPKHVPKHWQDCPFDVLRLVYGRLGPHDVQATVLVCREWHTCFATGLLNMRPHMLRVGALHSRLVALQL